MKKQKTQIGRTTGPKIKNNSHFQHKKKKTSDTQTDQYHTWPLHSFLFIIVKRRLGRQPPPPRPPPAYSSVRAFFGMPRSTVSGYTMACAFTSTLRPTPVLPRPPSPSDLLKQLCCQPATTIIVATRRRRPRPPSSLHHPHARPRHPSSWSTCPRGPRAPRGTSA